ncbi:MAG: hypothetical protein V2I38_16900, partial [Alcanivoracaceae bacterium]|nr:hypothetical protein [Alcanivoracaceae bacterium]
MIAVCFGQLWCWVLAALLWLLTGWFAGWRRAACLIPLAMLLALYTQSQLDRALSARLPYALTGEELQFQARVRDLPVRLTLGLDGPDSAPLEQVRFVALAQSTDPRWP